MNTLSNSKKALVLSSLAEGNSVRSTERIKGVHRDTILGLVQSVAKKCEEVSSRLIQNLKVKSVQVDEICSLKELDLDERNQISTPIGCHCVFPGWGRGMSL